MRRLAPLVSARPADAIQAADPISIAGADAGLIALDLSLVASALTITGGVALTGTITADWLAVSGTLALSGAASLFAASATVSSGALLAEGGGATLAVAGALTLTGEAAALDGGSIVAGSLVLAGGTLGLDAASAFAIGGAADAGSIAISFGAWVSGSGQINAPLENDGMVLAQGGALALFGGVEGSGALAIGANGTLYLPRGLPAALPLAFAGANATLDLLTLAQARSAPLTGFVPGDAIAFAEARVTGAVWQAGTLTLAAADGGSLALSLPGDFAASTFICFPDGMGGSVVKLPSASIGGMVVADITLGDGNDLLELAGTSSAGALTANNQVALAGHAAIGTLTLNGVLAVLPGAVLLAGDIAGFGVLAIEGAGAATIANATGLAATIEATGGASIYIAAATLAGGTFSLDAVSTLVIGAAAPQAGTVAIAVGATLAGYGRMATPADVAGCLRVQGGALVIGAPVGGSGSLEIAPGGTLTVFAPVTLPVWFGGNATLELDTATLDATLENLAAGDVLDVAGIQIDAAMWSAGVLTLSAGGTVLRTLSVAGGYDGQDWAASPDGHGGTLIALSSGTGAALHLTGTQTLSGETLSATSVSLAAGAQLTGYGSIAGALDLDGMLTVSSGLLSVGGGITGGGTVQIGSNATLYAPRGIAGTASVVFTGGNATLELFGPALATGAVIAGMEASPGEPFGNAIDLAAVNVTHASYIDLGGGNGALALSGAAGSFGTLALAGISAPPSILVLPDGNGGSLIELVPCFAAGTRIATPDGGVPVEQLRPGDWVATQSGPRRLRWVAARRADATAAPELRPVCITAGALGGGLPWRDLYVSPRHALLLRRVLVPAVALLNGHSIHRAPAGHISYHHIGLDTHSIVWAEGAAAESFLPSGDPVLFDREAGRRPLPGPAHARVIDSGGALETLRRRLFGVAAVAANGPLLGHIEHFHRTQNGTRVEGWALNPAMPDRPVSLLAWRDGAACGRTVANHWRPDLDRAGLAGGRCAFVLDVPGRAVGLAMRQRPNGPALPGPAVECDDI